MKTFVTTVLSLALLMLNACAELSDEHIGTKNDHICKEDGVKRECTKKERMMIDDMHAIIRSIRNFENHPEAVLGQQNSPSPQVLFFGENHMEVIGKIQTLGLINHFAKSGDVILLEGRDRKEAFESHCASYLIFEVFEAWQFLKRGQPYDSDKISKLSEQEKYHEIWKTTFNSYDLSGLNLLHLRCGFWDDVDALSITNSYRQTKTRNVGMVEAIDWWRKRADRVLINAGFLHLPSGEQIAAKKLQSASSTNLIPDDMPNFYAFVKTQRRLPLTQRVVNLYPHAGSTKPIYDYLIRTRTPYLEVIHGTMVYR